MAPRRPHRLTWRGLTRATAMNAGLDAVAHRRLLQHQLHHLRTVVLLGRNALELDTQRVAKVRVRVLAVARTSSALQRKESGNANQSSTGHF